MKTAIINKSRLVTLTLISGAMFSFGIALACESYHEGPSCPQKHGACTLIDDTEITYVKDTGVASGYNSVGPDSLDECGYQCGTEYEGVGHQLSGSGTCPSGG